MPLPVIKSITATPATINECEQTLVEITATGGKRKQFALAVKPGSRPAIITQDPVRPNLFKVTALCPDNPDHDPVTHTTPHNH